MTAKVLTLIRKKKNKLHALWRKHDVMDKSCCELWGLNLWRSDTECWSLQKACKSMEVDGSKRWGRQKRLVWLDLYGYIWEWKSFIMGGRGAQCAVARASARWLWVWYPLHVYEASGCLGALRRFSAAFLCFHYTQKRWCQFCTVTDSRAVPVEKTARSYPHQSLSYWLWLVRETTSFIYIII